MTTYISLTSATLFKEQQPTDQISRMKNISLVIHICILCNYLVLCRSVNDTNTVASVVEVVRTNATSNDSVVEVVMLNDSAVKYETANENEGFRGLNEVVRIESGDLLGTMINPGNGEKSIYWAFFGIPYAKPPVGELRFRAPQRVDPWEDVLVANRSDVSCFQRDLVTKDIGGEEDCLVLNLYRSKTSGASILPVMVWFHGGGFQSGSSSNQIYGPDYLIQQDVIVVTVNYRVGPLGFLSVKDPTVSGNAGLKDQVASLQWVQRNIACFGGDPTRVTIFGQSAGSSSVHMHVLSPMSKGLFHGAIAQSGCALNPWSSNPLTRNASLDLARALSCDVTHMMACMRNATAETLLQRSVNISTGSNANASNHMKEISYTAYPPFVPSVETDTNQDEELFLPDSALSLLRSGRFNRVPLMFGTTADEAMLYVGLYFDDDTETEQIFHKMISKYVPMKDLQQAEQFAYRIKKYYFGNKEVSSKTMTELVKMFTDWTFWLGITDAIKLHTALSHSPVYLYKFSYDGPLGFVKRVIGQATLPGVVHGDELGYLFKPDIFDVDLNPEDISTKTMLRMVKMWTNFAKTGNPSSELTPVLNVTWSPVTSSKMEYLLIGSQLSMEADLGHERMDFWKQLYDDAANGVVRPDDVDVTQNEVEVDDKASDQMRVTPNTALVLALVALWQFVY